MYILNKINKSLIHEIFHMKTILISTSRFGTPIPDYFKYLGERFNKNNFSVHFYF